jgi:hypothetical protein
MSTANVGQTAASGKPCRACRTAIEAAGVKHSMNPPSMSWGFAFGEGEVAVEGAALGLQIAKRR